ncbi:PLANT UBX DOMAIN-CONTAINING PROTEIN 11 [Salix viminalis]|uniref:PLANT UBX DOMAIN-CONTAINING PROTEIN 11 n=1 Tax=Salix viminalis TaxID=40686 RepID=A0A9Q0SI52_SALVM|nr:PLANT UBX DOMAIN-CONTAINING PROTEIN 11 [Salix viminalis]
MRGQLLNPKNKRNYFVVYISGENAASAELGKSTWTDSKVAESLSKYCILLHIPEGSTDAVNFSAIYRQKSAPCITAIGYNGVQLWQSEGFVTAEVLASRLEKAWLTLHIQETTATVLTATLASKKPEPPSGSSEIGSSGQGSSSGTVVPAPLKDRHIQPSEAGTQAAASEVIEENKSHEPAAEKTITNVGDKTSSKSFNVRKSQAVGDERSTCPTEEDKKFTQFFGGSELSASDIKVGDKKAESMDDVVPRTLNNNKKVNVSSDVHLNIRLPDGVSLQEKFSVTSTLRMVKDYVDRNQASGIGAYDLAIPYPRKIFSDQDLNKSLSELSLLNRQALIVVFHQRAASYHQRGSFVRQGQLLQLAVVHANSSSFWDKLNLAHGNMAQIQHLRITLQEWTDPPPVHPQIKTHHQLAESDSKGKQPTTSHVGSNIHTLKHDEDDSRFSERNSFWNGNSTEYGGDNDAK